MGAGNVALYAFNRGLISRFALARTDLKRMALSASVMTNWIPRTLGSMMLRPGSEYINQIGITGAPKHVPFIFANNSTAILQFGQNKMRVLVNEAEITRVAVTTTITNGAFAAGLTGWTNADQAGTASVGSVSGLRQVGNLFNYAVVYQQITVSGGNVNKEHALRIVVGVGPVVVRVGTALSGEDYVPQTILRTGTHSLAFTPSGNFFLEFDSLQDYTTNVASVSIEAAGVMEIPAIWPATSLPYLRWDQSADVVFFANDGYRQQRVERHATRSWSVVDYQPIDGPFDTPNATAITLSTSSIAGDMTITASQPVFRTGHLGALISVNSVGQTVDTSLAGANQFTDWIEVTGQGGSRTFNIAIAGTFVATVVLQRSVGAPGVPADVSGKTWTAPTTETYNDNLDNQIVFYRLGIKAAYTSGTAVAGLNISSGSILGVAQIATVTDSSHVNVRVFKHFGNTGASSSWALGLWSTDNGFPTSCRLYQGRLWWLGRGTIVGSVSAAYASFDQTIEGDSGPVIEQIGSGPVDVISWAQQTQRLVIGAESREISARSSAINEPLTPTDFNLVDVSTMGAAPVDAAKVDTNIFFVQAARQHMVKMTYQPSYFGLDYSSSRMTEINPDLGLDGGGFQQIVVQRKPDTRIHCRLGDGTVAIQVYDEAEDVQAWVLYQFAGGASVIDMFVLPDADGGSGEDRVYYVIDFGAAGHWLVRWATQDQCIGGTLNLQLDGYVTYSGAPTATVTGLPYADGSVVSVWADGKSVDNPDGTLAAFTVSGGAITLPLAVSNAVVGLPYTAQFKSTKLAYAAQSGTALLQPKRVTALGVVAADIHPRGLQYGPSFDKLQPMQLIYRGTPVDPDAVMVERDDITVPFPGSWDTDSRLCLQAAAPRPCTLLAAIMELETNEKS